MKKTKFEEKLDEIFEGIIVESRTPKVGIYWFKGNEIISFTEEVRGKKPVADFIDSEHDHYHAWDKLKIKGDYTSLPRGRVIKNVKEDKYLVYVPSDMLGDKKKLVQIFREFSLPTDKIKIVTDTHYEMGGDPFADDDYYD
jgi:hypothetical protein